jgi:hypothetical protein
LWNDYCRLLNNNSWDGNCVADGNGSYRADGMVQPTEGYIAGVTVQLQAGACATDNPTVIATAVTDASGKYVMANVLPGNYCVFINALAGGNANIMLPGDWTFPQTGIWYQPITVGAGEQVAPVNFGWDYQLQ